MERLKIYQTAIALVVKIYKLTKSSQSLMKEFSLCDQLKRAAVSVVTNIAEGYYRSKKQWINYLHISSGSTNEVVTILIIINLIYQINTCDLQQEYIVLGKQINSFASKLI